MLGKEAKQTLEMKKAQMKKIEKKRHEFEMENKGGYELIFPTNNPEYKKYLETS